MIKKRKKKYPQHDEKTCFRCRLHSLVEELYPKGIGDDGDLVLVALAEAVGQLLAQSEEMSKHLFMTSVMRFYHEEHEEYESHTKH
jgi:hypothetical protein